MLVSGRISFTERKSFCENQVKLQKHILIVEDEPDAAELLELNLKNAGFKVTVAEDGEQALKKVHKLLPDLVILDLMIPDQWH